MGGSLAPDGLRSMRLSSRLLTRMSDNAHHRPNFGPRRSPSEGADTERDSSREARERLLGRLALDRPPVLEYTSIASRLLMRSP